MDEQQIASMTQEVTQWLAEIKSLQQQIMATRQERDEALNSAANWRQLYETEAKQRRTDAKLMQQTLDQAQRELAQLKGEEFSTPADGTDAAFPLLDLDEASLRHHVQELNGQCDRLRQALQRERESHEQTRKSLTSALGDAVDQLAQVRNQSLKAAGQVGQANISSPAAISDTPESS
jgi:chromosome segregation ATPase